MKHSIIGYTLENTLLIPESLYKMEEAQLIMAHGCAAIFHKLIHKDMRDIEFYTNAPCLAFVLSGCETFTSADHEDFLIEQEEMLFMGQGQHMVSDFINSEGPLEAVLFFFDEKTIFKFLQSCSNIDKAAPLQSRPFKVKSSPVLTNYVSTIKLIYQGLGEKSYSLLQTKLLELLLLLEALDTQDRLRGFLAADKSTQSKRNIKHVMNTHLSNNFSIKDFASLSGRSLSSFNRDFKRLYGITPSKWLKDKRLGRAKELVNSSELSMTEIAMAVGYSNTSHFIKSYREKYAVTPKQARKRTALL
ncbi:helix-turn-helix domain-containing protein [Flexibacterium corallicola]|uniref:helix-turn-helix domain-containing protein n=1 Tax=Flexibacterium corallicola TaxID=3037259 RepID=UPI00286FA086|nr:AraC family transcriptional regulator [Pseudovibrio sp. M1P-2-3]